MLYYEGMACPVCNQPFTGDDDVVVCPQCGLPHHRECWLKENRCHAEEWHGTDKQWSRENARKEVAEKASPPSETPSHQQICPRCYTKNPEFAEICTHCGNILHPSDWSASGEDAQPQEENYTPYRAAYNNHENQYSPVDRIGEVSAAELAAFVGNNADYYIPRLRRAANGESGGWHWAGFLLGPIWLLYRKQYLLGSFMFIMQILLNVLTTVLYLPVNAAQTSQEMMTAMMEVAAHPMFMPVWVLSSVLFVGRLLLGLRGSNLYYYHCVRKIAAIKRRVPDISAPELVSMGGTSVAMIVVFYVVSMIINSALTSFMSM